jgi:hypothetical protein
MRVYPAQGLTSSLKSKLTERQKKIEHLKRLKLQFNESRNTELDGESFINHYIQAFKNIDLIFDKATLEEKKRLIRYFINKVTINKEKERITFNFYKIPLVDTYTTIPYRSTAG